MKVIEVKRESIDTFTDEYLGFNSSNGCNSFLTMDYFLIRKDKLEADKIKFILDEVTNMTRTEVESVVTFKKETYDSINNKYVKQ